MLPNKIDVSVISNNSTSSTTSDDPSSSLLMNFDMFEVAKKQCYNVLKVAIDNLDIYDFNINSRDTNGNTLLHILASYGNLDCTLKLLQKGAKPNIFNNNFATPLHLACKNGHLKVAKLLINHQADIEVTDKFGETPLFKAVRSGHSDIVIELMRHLPSDILSLKNICGHNLLHLAVEMNDPDLVGFLLTNGLDPNEPDASLMAPLQLAVALNLTDIVAYFLVNRGDVHLRDHRRNTLLHHATVVGSETIAQLLINHRIDINAVNTEGETALHWAVQLNRLQLVELLLRCSEINVNIQDADGYSPLHVAASDDNLINCLDLLVILAGRDLKIDCKTFAGDTALDRAKAVRNVRAAALLAKQMKITQFHHYHQDRLKS